MKENQLLKHSSASGIFSFLFRCRSVFLINESRCTTDYRSSKWFVLFLLDCPSALIAFTAIDYRYRSTSSSATNLRFLVKAVNCMQLRTPSVPPFIAGVISIINTSTLIYGPPSLAPNCVYSTRVTSAPRVTKHATCLIPTTRSLSQSVEV